MLLSKRKHRTFRTKQGQMPFAKKISSHNMNYYHKGGVFMSGGGYEGGYGGGYGSGQGFALIVVLFILLIIVGAAFVY